MLDILWLLKPWLLYGAIFAGFAMACARGAAPERWCLGTLVAMLVLDRTYHLVTSQVGIEDSVDVGHLLIDLFATVSFVTVALKANRVYPIWLAGLELAALMTHLVRGMQPPIVGAAYAILNMAPSYLLMIVSITGLVAHIRRTKVFGSYPSWRNSSSHSWASVPTGPRII